MTMSNVVVGTITSSLNIGGQFKTLVATLTFAVSDRSTVEQVPFTTTIQPSQGPDVQGSFNGATIAVTFNRSQVLTLPFSTTQASSSLSVAASAPSTRSTSETLAGSEAPTRIFTELVTALPSVPTTALQTSPSFVPDIPANLKGVVTSSGALAGGAVACFIVGLITAALCMWAMLSRRRKRGSKGFLRSATAPTVADTSESSSNNGHKYAPIVAVPVPNTTKELPPSPDQSNDNEDRELGTLISPIGPQSTAAAVMPMSALTIKRKRVSAASASGLAGTAVEQADRSFAQLLTQVKTLFEQIEMHVDNFYVHDAINIRLDDKQQESLRRLETPYLPDSIIGLLPEASGESVKTLLKHAIAYAVFSRTLGTDVNETNDTLLPIGLQLMVQCLNSSPANLPGRQDAAKKCQWKAMTVSLMDVPAIVKSTEIKAKVGRLSDLCIRALEPWSVARYGFEARRSHLARIMEEAVESGLTMFGEEQGWLVWQWETDAIDPRGGDVVVFPGLELKQSPSNGRMGSRAETDDATQERRTGQVILAPTTATLQL